MADRARLLVAYLLRGRDEIEVDVLRKMLKSSEIERIAPHITLIPPVNVGQTQVGELSRLLEMAVTTVEPVPLVLQGVDTFQPQKHVLYLPVCGAIEQLSELRNRCRVGSLSVAGERSFVPHVTIKSHADPDLVASTRAVAGAFNCPIVVDRVSILERDVGVANGIWSVRDEFVLGSERHSGRGGREIVCTRSTFVNNNDQHFLVDNGIDALLVTRDDPALSGDRVVVRARVAGELVGLCVVQLRGHGGEILALAVDSCHRNEGIGRQILRYLEQSAGELSLSEISVSANDAVSGFFCRLGFENWRALSRHGLEERFIRAL